MIPLRRLPAKPSAKTRVLVVVGQELSSQEIIADAAGTDSDVTSSVREIDGRLDSDRLLGRRQRRRSAIGCLSSLARHTTVPSLLGRSRAIAGGA